MQEFHFEFEDILFYTAKNKGGKKEVFYETENDQKTDLSPAGGLAPDRLHSDSHDVADANRQDDRFTHRHNFADRYAFSQRNGYADRFTGGYRLAFSDKINGKAIHLFRDGFPVGKPSLYQSSRQRGSCV
ncbi:hypothetical protein SDC9_67964 [bioreactor metagenome]|uniref:Uncharacterized protein n=1 Tax=bioreactor metagenome TaxID=1076179 RepID=A0A644XZ59_9ZZZZ